MRGNRYDGFDDFTAKLIKRKARQLVGKAGITDADREDLEQELALHVLISTPRFDSSRAQFRTFIARVIDRKVASIIRGRKAAKRGYGVACQSLNEAIQDEDGYEVERLDLLEATADESADDLDVDLRNAIATLPPNLQKLYQRLKHGSPSEIARETGTARSTVYDQMKSIMRTFAKAGLKDYF